MAIVNMLPIAGGDNEYAEYAELMPFSIGMKIISGSFSVNDRLYIYAYSNAYSNTIIPLNGSGKQTNGLYVVYKDDGASNKEVEFKLIANCNISSASIGGCGNSTSASFSGSHAPSDIVKGDTYYIHLTTNNVSTKTVQVLDKDRNVLKTISPTSSYSYNLMYSVRTATFAY